MVHRDIKIIDIFVMAMLAVEPKTKRSFVRRCGEISLVLDQQAVSDLAHLPPLHIAAFDKRSLSTRQQLIIGRRELALYSCSSEDGRIVHRSARGRNS